MGYNLGGQIRFSVAITNSSGTPTDPTTVTCTVRKSDNTTTALSVVKDSTGNYHADLTPDLDGSWYVRWAGTGALVVAGEGTFEIERQRV